MNLRCLTEGCQNVTCAGDETLERVLDIGVALTLVCSRFSGLSKPVCCVCPGKVCYTAPPKTSDLITHK